MKITGWWSQEYPWYFLTGIESRMLLRHFTPARYCCLLSWLRIRWNQGPTHCFVMYQWMCVACGFQRWKTPHRHFDPRKESRSKPPFSRPPPLPLWLQVPLNVHCWWEAPYPGGHRGKDAGFRFRRMWGWIWPHILLPVWPLSNSCISLGLSILLHKIEWLPYKIDISIKW